MDKIKEVQDALCDVRKAHRIIYAYQKRMMDIVRFIGKKLNFPTMEGYKWFSNTAPRKIYSGTWAWDYIYTYLFEYFLGEQHIGNSVCRLSVIQYSDTGCFEQEKTTRTNLSTFAPEDQSVSKFLFILAVSPQESMGWWDVKEIIYQKEYASKIHKTDILKKGDSTIMLFSVPMEEVLDERSTMNVLKSFCSFCEDKGIISLVIH